MISRLAIVAAILGLAGCRTVSSNAVDPLTPPNNTVEFNRYVEQRSTTLLAMGAFKNASEAHAKAYQEASNRYGPRPGDSATFRLFGKRPAEPVDTAKLDALARNR